MVFLVASLLKFNNVQDNVLIHVIFRLVLIIITTTVYALVLGLYVPAICMV